jgi:TonB family protein
MRKSLFAISILLLFSTGVLGQSGRAKGSPGKSPAPPVPEASPKPDNPKLYGPPPPPKIVDGERIYTSREVDERLKILKKPDPDYTDQAERNRTRGLILLRAILSADGTVKNIQVLNGLPDGLTEKSIEAARRIKFKPAMKDGKAVSTWVYLEYRFDIY